MTPGFQYPASMIPDGERVLIQQVVGGRGAAGVRRIRLLNLSASDAAARENTLLDNASSPEISPDGRWLAYQSEESGRDEIYIRPFPNVDTGRRLISTAGGTRPAWSLKGDELFYIDAAGPLTAVPLQVAGSTITPGLPITVSRTPFFAGVSALGVTTLRAYDVVPDGRFLMIKDSAPSEQEFGPVRLVVRLNIAEALSARLSGQ